MNSALTKGTMLHTVIALALARGHAQPPRPLSFRALPSNLPPLKPKPKFVKQPGILDRIKLCESSEAAHTMWHEFLDSADNVSQKTINRATRLLTTLDFPLP